MAHSSQICFRKRAYRRLSSYLTVTQGNWFRVTLIKEYSRRLAFASRFERLSNTEKLLMTAARLQLDPPEPHLHTKGAYRFSTTLRSKGRILDSECVIRDFFSRVGPNWRQLLRHFLCLLHISQANNHMYHFDFCKGK
jgi:hypothetical protein